MTWIAIFVTAAACGGGSSGPDITGMYMVTHHTSAIGAGANRVSCTAEGTAETTPMFFSIVDDPDFGPTYEECDSMDPASCMDTVHSFFESRDDGWQTVSSNTSESGGLCTLYHFEDTAILQPDGSLVVEFKEWNDAMPSDCSLDAADQLAATDQCAAHEIVVGTKVGG